MLNGRESLNRLIGKRRRAFSSPLALSLCYKDDSKFVDYTEHKQLSNGGNQSGIAGKRDNENLAECVISSPLARSLCPKDDSKLVDYTEHKQLSNGGNQNGIAGKLDSESSAERVFSSPLALNLCPKDDSKLVDYTEHKQKSNGGSQIGTAGERYSEGIIDEWVSCPICSSSIRGNGFTVNSHIDKCLASGKKRKMSQRTLYQVNFISKPKHLTESCNLNMDKCEELSNENLMNKDAVKYEPSNPHFTGKDDDTKHAYILETFIVGRRFQEKIVLQDSAKVYAIREPQNVRDKHAIKVFCDYQSSRCPLGYLPRILAECLSPLIDDHHLKCEGSISSLPEHPLDPLPIILFCEKVVEDGDVLPDKYFEQLWEKVLLANDCTRSQSTNSTKYQQNFRLILENVMDNNLHLFTIEERHLLGCFTSLSDDAQRLLIRLYTRKGPWFRLSNILYKELSDIKAAIDEMQKAGFLCSISSEIQLFKCNIKELLDLLTVSELQQISKQWLPKNGICHGRKHELIEHMLSSRQNETRSQLPKLVFELVGECVMICSSIEAIFWRIQRLFFLNGEQDLSAFLLVDIGVIKFPQYSCNITHPIFKCRTDLLEYEEAIEVAQIMDESIDENNMEMTERCIQIADKHMITKFSEDIEPSVSETQMQFFAKFTAWRVYSKVLTLGVSIYERKHSYDNAVRLLRKLLERVKGDSRRGYWTLRLSVNLEHLGHFNESLLVAEKGASADPWIRAGSKFALQKRVLRLGKPPRRWKLPIYAETINQKIKEVTIVGRPLNSEIGAKNLFYGWDDKLCGVEQLALQHYALEGKWVGIHSEGGIWTTIFGLVMWDTIFSDVPNVFRSKFQMAPLDLLTDDFYVMRKDLVESQLLKIHEGMAEEILITTWQLRHGTSCQGVNWDRFSLSDLRSAVSCVGGRSLASLCRRLVTDYRSWSSGLPDLFLWRFNGEISDRGQAKLVEVKGPRDRLSEQQRAWIVILVECGFDVEVCKVKPSPES